MRIILIHRNFPGQFRYLAPALIKAGHKVGVLTWEKNQNPRPLPTAIYRHEMAATKGLTGFYHDNVENGAAAARVAYDLAKRGDAPDLVFGSINWGETLFMREVWPDARHLGYAEFCYKTRGLDTGFDPEFSNITPETDMRTVARTGHLILAGTRSDALLSPTEWQKQSFPEELHSKISVIHDGVDTNRIAPDASATYQVPDGPLLKMGDEVLTFVNRNLEPYRGYHILMRALPEVMKARPNCHVVMVGGDGRGYGPLPGGDKSWKQVMLDEVGDQLDLSRLHFTGRVPYADLLNLLRVGRAHVYMTYPFVLSWSMLEAMSLGCLVVGSDTAPVAEVIEDGVNGHLVDFFDVKAWSDKLIEVLSDPEAQKPLREAARQSIVERYDLHAVCLPKLLDFVYNAGV